MIGSLVSAPYPILPTLIFRRGCGRSRSCCDGLFLKNLQDVTRIGTVAIVDIRVRIDDDPIAVDDVGCWYRQRPFARRAIASPHIQIESAVGLREFIGKFTCALAPPIRRRTGSDPA